MNITYEEEYHVSKILMVSCYSITFVVGIIGNGLVIWISGFRMKAVSAVWFLNLAIADFIFCLSLPIRVMDWLFTPPSLNDIDSFQVFLISFNFLMLATNSVVSVTFLTVISVHRCVSTMCPLWAKVHLTRRSARIASVFLWLVPLTSTVLINVCSTHYSSLSRGFLLLVPKPSYVMLADEPIFTVYEPADHITFTLTINSVFTFGVPFAIILVCNGLIVFKLSSNKFRRPKAFQRTYKLIVSVIVCFFVCWFPFNIWPCVAIRMGVMGSLTDFIMSSVCLCLISISSCMNPLLYVLVGHTRGAKSLKLIKARLENAINDFK
ncbi:chemerin-like receptor 1 [Mantella aurantiaca]